jgi:hypothetical protein
MTAAPQLRNSGIPGSGLRRARIRGAATLVCTVAVGLSACGSATPDYGQLPSWLPTSTTPAHRIVEASAARPQLGVEGDTMSVILAAGRVTVTAVGPGGTTQGHYPVPATTPCTFVLTFLDATGSVPIQPGDFTILDELGHLHHPRLSVDGAPAPTAIPAGAPVNLLIDDVLPSGSGQLRWAADGRDPIASWDFSVEID